MRSRRVLNIEDLQSLVHQLAPWLEDPHSRAPSSVQLAQVVRETVRFFATKAPGSTVELRVPPFIAVQCIAGPAHRRGNPPNVVETDPRTWLLLATGRAEFDQELITGTVTASGPRAHQIATYLPLFCLDAQRH